MGLRHYFAISNELHAMKYNTWDFCAPNMNAKSIIKYIFVTSFINSCGGFIHKSLHPDGLPSWHNATVPYYIESNVFSMSEVQIINEAMDEIENNSCIKFTPFDGDSHITNAILIIGKG